MYEARRTRALLSLLVIHSSQQDNYPLRADIGSALRAVESAIAEPTTASPASIGGGSLVGLPLLVNVMKTTDPSSEHNGVFLNSASLVREVVGSSEL